MDYTLLIWISENICPRINIFGIYAFRYFFAVKAVKSQVAGAVEYTDCISVEG